MITLDIKGKMCANCAANFEKKAESMPEIKNIQLNYALGKIKVEPVEEESSAQVVTKLQNLCQQMEPSAYLEQVQELELSQLQAEVHKPVKDSGYGSIIKEHQGEIQKILLSLALMIIAILVQNPVPLKLGLFALAYIIVGKDVLATAWSNIRRGEVFDENFLMGIATLGAFAIGEYPEGVAVMVFYAVGELFQDMAVKKSRASIKDLMDIRPDYANLKTGGEVLRVNPQQVAVGDIIVVRPGEKVPMDGILTKGKSQFDTASLTGESLPRTVDVGQQVLSGFVNKNNLVEIQVEKTFENSTAAKILELVENASAKKAATEKFITKFARYYTPAVVLFAALLAIVPPFFTGYNFNDWIYRALVFLVISCPCALVISIPLGFFGGIGAASSKGILVKGGNYLESLSKAKIAVFDKTGTLTEGKFSVREIAPAQSMTRETLLKMAAYGESFSTHPIAASIVNAYGQEVDKSQIEEHQEIEGEGIVAVISGDTVIVGNGRLMNRYHIPYEEKHQGTIVHVAMNGVYAGNITIDDSLKKDTASAIAKLKQDGLTHIAMLTGDNQETAQRIASEAGIDVVKANLLPGDKVQALEEIMSIVQNSKDKVLFTGDGINDAPVLARADVGIAMGGVGSDAAIEAADVVIMTDELSKIPEAIDISKKTIRVVWQNIWFTFGVKALVLTLGAMGMATMWEAVFADVGVAVIAILNATRIRKM